MSRFSFLESIYRLFFSALTKKRTEQVILSVSIVSYLIHLILIYLSNLGYFPLKGLFFSDYISAIYTPFSFILIYEVYLLIYYIPKSISVYIAKQYEIITLIVIRRIFKDISGIELSSNWFEIKNDLQFTYDIIATLILFAFILLFYKQMRYQKRTGKFKTSNISKKIIHFINLKKIMAVLLVPVLLVMSLYSFGYWLFDLIQVNEHIVPLSNVNNVFFDSFFTLLIVTDVLLLLASFFYSDAFHQVIRNSGFVISTVLIKVSFSTQGILNVSLILGAVFFGLVILYLHNQYEKLNPISTNDHIGGLPNE